MLNIWERILAWLTREWSGGVVGTEFEQDPRSTAKFKIQIGVLRNSMMLWPMCLCRNS